MDTMTSSINKVRWGDSLDEDDSLPPNSVVGPDKHGIQTITDYKRNDNGEVVKTVTKVRISKVERKCYAVRCCSQTSILIAALYSVMEPLARGACQDSSEFVLCWGWGQVAAERRNRLKRFGEALKETAGDSVTVRQAEDIPFERMQKARQTTEEKRAEKEDLKSALAGSDKSAVVGRSAEPLFILRAGDTASMQSEAS